MGHNLQALGTASLDIMGGLEFFECTPENFEALARQFRETENKRVEAGVTVGSLDLEFAVNTWITDREQILKAIGTVLDKMLEVEGRTTGTFKIVVKLPEITQ